MVDAFKHTKEIMYPRCVRYLKYIFQKYINKYVLIELKVISISSLNICAEMTYCP